MELSSALMHANARSIALVNATALAGDGSYGGVRLMSPETVSESAGGIVSEIDASFQLRFGFSRGGYGSFKESFFGDDNQHGSNYHQRIFYPEDRTAYGNFMGWCGAGGSLSLADRERNVAFAYCMNGLGLNLVGGARTTRILLALQKALAEE